MCRYRDCLGDADVKVKFGSLYLEFKNDRGFASSLFYTVYLIRRTQFMFTLIFLDYCPAAQIGLNIGFSLAQFMYLTYFRPFKEKITLFSEFIGELCIILLFLISIGYLPGNDKDLKVAVDLVFIILVVVAIALQSLASFFGLFLKFGEFYKKIKKFRARKGSRFDNKIHADKINFEEDSIGIKIKVTAPHETVKDPE